VPSASFHEGNCKVRSDIVGTNQYGDHQPNQLSREIDPGTLPSQTLQPVDTNIDPLRSHLGTDLPQDPTTEPRYRLLNGIIEFRNGVWFIAFTSVSVTGIHHVRNFYARKQLKSDGKG
jgi:hypothetical protein